MLVLQYLTNPQQVLSFTSVKITKIKQSQNTKQHFSLLIPTWNNLKYLRLCIQSIRKNSFFTHQIIVHINEGKDGTLDWVKQQKDIDYSYSTENIGICYALNIARSLAHTDYIAYINDDMYLCPHWDRVLWQEIQNIGQPYFFLSSTMIEPFDTKNPCVIVKNFGKDWTDFNEAQLLKEVGQLQKVDWNGSTWPPNVVHKDIWDLVGGYSIEFSPGMYSDPDFSLKLWKAGVRIFKGIGKSKVYHFGCKSTGRVKKNKSRKLFIKKWGISSRDFRENYLKMGTPYRELPQETPPLGLYQKWLNKLKSF